MQSPFMPSSDVPRQPVKTLHPRVQSLVKLPLFHDLAGRSAVIVGGTDAAAWKAELLAAAGAAVTAFAAAPGEEIVKLGSLRLVRRPWRPADFSGAEMVVADARDDAEAAAIRAAAKTARVPVNVIDRPEFCDFQFGAVVNRSPVVVGISTDGTAPVLAQAIRRRIETLLPPGLGRWAKVAGNLRGFLAGTIAEAGRRRAVWERFADRALAGDPASDPAAAAAALVDDPGRQTGRVTLVGAGPGEAEYLTLKALRALQSADVILFDDLVSDEVLELARREAKRMLVGKRAGRPSCRQADINALMIALARKGKHVVRLKSGDPAVFGRAGEEIAELKAAGIPVAVVPGITAALALAARLGVSLTHRDHAHSVRFVTGHIQDGGLPRDLDWRGLADRDTTLVVYMGGRTAAALAARLIGAGLPPSTPAVCARALGRPAETVVAGRLDGLAGMAGDLGSDDPVLIGIGPVFAGVGERGEVAPVAAPALAASA